MAFLPAASRLTLIPLALLVVACSAEAPPAQDGPLASEGQASIADTPAPSSTGPVLDGFPLLSTAMIRARARHTASRLLDGKVLVAGGTDGSAALAGAELYDPLAVTWTAVAPLSEAREQHAAVVLASGKVLVVGGLASGAALASAELYDPQTSTWTPAAPMALARSRHTASLLANGRVLVIGGTDGAAPIASAELYDPQANTWTAAAPPHARALHTATVLPGSRVLVAGGADASGPLAGVEQYDAATDHWSPAAPMAQGRSRHAATLLADGSLLITGGADLAGASASVERYTPATNTWALEGSMATARADHTAALTPLGRVLVAGGTGAGGPLASAEMFEPTISAHNLTYGTSLTAWTTLAPPSAARADHTATALASGDILFAGGAASASSEVFDDTPAPLGTPCGATAQCASGFCSDGVCCNVDCPSSGGCQHCDATGTCQMVAPPFNYCDMYNTSNTCYTGTGQCNSGHCGFILPGTQVDTSCKIGSDCIAASCNPVAHGCSYDFVRENGVKSSFNVGTTCFAGASYSTAKPAPLGGDCTQNADCQSGSCSGGMCVKPCLGSHCWSSAGGVMKFLQFTGASRARLDHAAVLLPGGDLLMIGGQDQIAPPFHPGSVTRELAIVDRLHPATNTWSTATKLGTGRFGHVGLALPNGKVLVAGGKVQAADPLFHLTWIPTASAELYDPVANTWTAAANLHAARFHFTATLLPSGAVLVAGGDGSPQPQSAEVYDPQANAWSLTAPMASAHADAATALLSNGEALMIGGLAGSSATAITERYAAPIDAWSLAAPLPAPRAQHTATRLASGDVLVAGGIDAGGVAQTSAYLYDSQADTWSTVAPMASARALHAAALLPDGRVLVAGGNAGAEVYDPATDTWSPFGSMLTTARRRLTLTLLPDGRALAGFGLYATDKIYAPLNAESVVLQPTTLGAPCSTNADCPGAFCADGVCCNAPCTGGVCDACTVALGATADGTCTLFTGSSCDDANACTTGDTCLDGTCSGDTTVVCPPPAVCHLQSTCDPQTGTCGASLPALDGTYCAGGGCVAGACSPIGASSSSSSGVGGSASSSSASSGVGGSSASSSSASSGVGGSSASSSASSGVGGSSASSSSASSGAGGSASSSSASSGVGGSNASSSSASSGTGGSSASSSASSGAGGGSASSSSASSGVGGGASASTSTGAGGASSSSVASSGVGGAPTGNEPGGSGDCGCRAAGTQAGDGGWIGLGLCALLVARRRRMSRSACT